MNVFEAVDSRIACRAFLDKPVDPEIVRDLIGRAARAASGGNLQSWQVYALAGVQLYGALKVARDDAADWLADRLAGKPFASERWCVIGSGEIAKTAY
jgi:nitroreductase